MRKLVLVLLVLACTLCLYAAGQTEQDTTDDGRISISAFHMFTTEESTASAQVTKQAIIDFQERHPEVDYSEEVLAHDAYEIKMKTYVAANQLPDLFMVKGTMIPILVESGQIRPIDDLIDKYPDWRPSIKDGALSIYSSNGQTYGTSSALTSNHVVFWNEELFAKAGIEEFPKTWDEFMSIIPKLKAIGVVPIALGNKGKAAAESCILNTIAYRCLDTQWYQDIYDFNGNASFTDPEFVAAVQYLQDLANAGAFNSDMNSIEKDQSRAMYYNEQAAMQIDGEWAIASLVATASPELVEKTRLTILPEIPGWPRGSATRVAGGPSWGWVVNANVTDPEKLDLIAEFLYDTTGPVCGARVLEKSSTPLCKPAEYDENLISSIFKDFTAEFENYESCPVFDLTFPPNVVDALYSNLQSVLINKMTAQEYAELAQQELELAHR